VQEDVGELRQKEQNSKSISSGEDPATGMTVAIHMVSVRSRPNLEAQFLNITNSGKMQ
jgi:hypothetical protein